jgi:ankyrin repeat protein
MEAAKEDNTRIVRLLLNMSPLTKRDAEGKTVLHYAVLKTKHETSDFLELIRDMVKIARSKHPDSEFIDALDSNYGSPLYYCVDIGKLKTATILLELRAKINPFEGSQRNENDVFVHAAQLENKDMLGVLMKNGATYDLNALRKSHRVSKGIISYIRSEQKKY